MISGKLALGGLSVEFGKQEERYTELEAHLEALTKKQDEFLRGESEIIEKLALIYLPELTKEAVLAGPRELETQMRESLAKQASLRSDLNERLRALPSEIARGAQVLLEAEAAEARASEALENVRRTVEAELAADRTHSEQVREHRALMERRSLLKTRRARLQAAANVERPRYEAHRPFTYLQQRAYGEPSYKGGPITRRLDAWLARRIDFDSLQRAYRILRTGPHAIQAEIRSLTAAAGELEALIDEQEERVAERRGLRTALEDHARAQTRVVEAKKALAEVRASHDRIAAELRGIAVSKGTVWEQALDVQRAFLEQQSVRELLRIAQESPDPRDDDLIPRLETLRDRLQTTAQEISAVRSRLEREARRTTTIADVARNAVTHFTSRRSLFPDDFRLERFVQSMFDQESSVDEAMTRLGEAHTKRPVLVAEHPAELGGWFAELSSVFDRELGALSLDAEGGSEVESEIVVRDADGTIIHRRVTRRGEPGR